MPTINFVTLEGKIEDIGSLHLVRAEWQHDRSRFVLIRYTKDGREEPLGLRLDLDKKVLLDYVGDPELDKSIQALTPSLWSIISTERLRGNVFQGYISHGIDFRATGPLDTIQRNLGLLGDLPGTFIGSGLNLSARPDKQNNNPFFLELSATQEILEFTNIGGDIPNRGSIQSDINLHGVRYLQRIADCATHTAIHLEPGLWLRVPAMTAPDPKASESYARLATIPYGVSILAQSTFFMKVNGGPQIAPVDSTPFTGDIPDLNSSPANPVTNADYLKPFSETPLPAECLPAGLDAVQTIKNPALVLQAAIAGQNITETIVIQISTAPVGGIVNIPFVVQNANATRLDAIFWIEKVANPAGGAEPFIQLQYVQRVILDFLNIHWPHISVATLVKTL